MTRPFPRRPGAAKRLAGLLSPALAILAAAAVSWGQDWPGKPPIPEDLRAAMAQADAGAPDALVRLADSGRADAQFYAGAMYLLGRGAIAKDPTRGCAYAQKASATRADAMHLTGECYRLGLGGAADADKAKQAYARAAEMGFTKSRCALGQMLLAEPAEAPRGLALCKESATAGDVDAQVTMGDIYFSGRGAAADHAQARKWYEMAAKQNTRPQANRKLGQMYAQGDGGKRNTKKAVELWQAAEKAGDPLAAILVADQLFSDVTGGRKPGPGKYAFRGGVPVADIEVVEQWYRQALDQDPRPDVKQRATQALAILAQFKTASQATPSSR